MLAVKAIKIEAVAEGLTESILDGQSRICNWLYNHLLELAGHAKQEFKKHGDAACAKKVYTKRGLRDEIPVLKAVHPFLKTVHSSPLKNVGLRLSSAIQAHSKGKKGQRKGQSGWPKFRSWNTHWFSLYYDEPNKGFKVEGSTLSLILGVNENDTRLSCKLQLKEPELLEGKEIRNFRLVKENGTFYAIFTVLTQVPDPKPVRKVIAIDPNHKNFGVGVDTEGVCIEIAAPIWIKTYDKRIDELKSKRDRCNKKAKTFSVLDQKGTSTGKTYTMPSNNWSKRNKTLQTVLRKRREQTKTFLSTLAQSLF